jgi:L,D-peptidoglycan transpeptidase YkuD (ErfK/YbiS/YcfS/YnhG family)
VKITQSISYFLNLHILLLLLSFQLYAADDTSPIPASSNQIILMITDSTTATKGILYYMDRENNEEDWRMAAAQIPVVLGRSGLGWGIGLHQIPENSEFPVKAEGDGRSPAGVFSLRSVFGYSPVEKMTYLKMLYIHITDVMECIDDINSKYYNQIVSREAVEESDIVDWQSSEKMRNAGIYYELGVIVDHNSIDIKNGGGSCIFLHNWATPDETMAGCTAMSPDKMKEIVYWLDESKNPILVQLTKQLYRELMKEWNLPQVSIFPD